MNIGKTRLRNQGIADPSFTQPAAVVEWLGAMQAQDYAGALWAIGLRMQSAEQPITVKAIGQAIAARTIIRTWPMRRTLHFVAAQDVRWLLALLTPRMIAQTAARYRQLALDDALFARSQAIFVAALQGQQERTRAELYQQLEAAGIATDGQRGYHLLVRAAQDGVICFGVPRGKEQTFTLLDDWVPPANMPEREAALAELARRYFTSHGPATVKDLARWAGLTMRDARVGIAEAGKALEQVRVDGDPYWLSQQMAGADAEEASLYLLPGFDEFVLGYGERSAVLDPAFAERICPGRNGVFYPTVVIDGQIAGTWQRRLSNDAVAVEWSPFHTLTSTQTEALRRAAKTYARFLERPRGHR